jgi:hypothetical protein
MRINSDQSSGSLFIRIGQDHIVLTGFATTLLLCLVQWFLILFYIWRLPPEVPLYYNLALGTDQLADKIFLLLPPSFSLLFTVMWLLYYRIGANLIPFFHQLTSWLTTLVVLLAAISLLHIIILVY